MFDSLNPTKLAELQDEVISIGPLFRDRSPDYARGYDEALGRFEFMLNLGAATGTLPPNNLRIRQDVLRAALQARANGYMRASAAHAGLEAAVQLFRALCYPGPHGDVGAYSEGYSYFRYVRQAFDFWGAVVAPLRPSISIWLDGVQNHFNWIAAPDGSVPVTDTRQTDLALLVATETIRDVIWIDLPGITVRRTARSYVLVSHEAGIVRHRKNRHVSPDFGHYVIWRDGRWVVHHPWYEGYSAKQARKGQEREYLNVPETPANADRWRWWPFPPRLRSTKHIDERRASIIIDYGGQERLFTFGRDELIVQDRGEVWRHHVP